MEKAKQVLDKILRRSTEGILPEVIFLSEQEYNMFLLGYQKAIREALIMLQEE